MGSEEGGQGGEFELRLEKLVLRAQSLTISLSAGVWLELAEMLQRILIV
jgi:hypothetical protein